MNAQLWQIVGLLIVSVVMLGIIAWQIRQEAR